MKEWDRVCTPGFRASSAVIESVGRVQIVLLGGSGDGDR